MLKARVKSLVMIVIIIQMEYHYVRRAIRQTVGIVIQVVMD